MKKSIQLFAAITLGFSTMSGIAQPMQKVSHDPPTEKKSEGVVDITATVHEGQIFFNLRSINDSQGGFYSLVKYYHDGRFESVDLKEIVPNDLNTPLLYSFRENTLPKEGVWYDLIKVTDESVVVQSWKYSPEGEVLVAGHHGVFAKKN